MPKVLISVDEKLLRQIDRAAKRAGLSRSAYIARLATHDIEAGPGPGAHPDARRAIAEIQEMFRKNPPPEDFDWTAAIRTMRDERANR